MNNLAALDTARLELHSMKCKSESACMVHMSHGCTDNQGWIILFGSQNVIFKQECRNKLLQLWVVTKSKWSQTQVICPAPQVMIITSHVNRLHAVLKLWSLQRTAASAMIQSVVQTFSHLLAVHVAPACFRWVICAQHLTAACVCVRIRKAIYILCI